MDYIDRDSSGDEASDLEDLNGGQYGWDDDKADDSEHEEEDNDLPAVGVGGNIYRY